jgi:hypothetical protein
MNTYRPIWSPPNRLAHHKWTLDSLFRSDDGMKNEKNIFSFLGGQDGLTSPTIMILVFSQTSVTNPTYIYFKKMFSKSVCSSDLDKIFSPRLLSIVLYSQQYYICMSLFYSL